MGDLLDRASAGPGAVTMINNRICGHIYVTYSPADIARFRKEHGAEDKETHGETCESDHCERFRMKKERNGLAFKVVKKIGSCLRKRVRETTCGLLVYRSPAAVRMSRACCNP